MRRPKPAGSVRYGPHRSQVCDLYLPEGGGPHPVIVLVHGGYWQSMYDRSLMIPLAADLIGLGYAAWNIEYRRLGEPGGGWPGTFEDVAAAVDALATVPDGQVDLERVAAVGHSAGGHLALWIGARPGLPAGAPGADPEVKVGSVVGQAAVTDLRAAVAHGMGRGPALGLMGVSPDEDPARYDLASPIERLPMGIPQLLVHGEADHIVALEQSVSYAWKAANAGDPVELLSLPRVGHFDVIDPRHRSWRMVTDRLPRLI